MLDSLPSPIYPATHRSSLGYTSSLDDEKKSDPEIFNEVSGTLARSPRIFMPLTLSATGFFAPSRAMLVKKWFLLRSFVCRGASWFGCVSLSRSSHLQRGGTSTKYIVVKITTMVKLAADTQKTLCVSAMSRTSDVFIPNTLATNDSGRKITVMMVKTTVALSRQSCTPEICARAY